MHLLFYTRDILHLGSLSTGWTVAVLVGALYGLLRMIRDAIAGVIHFYQRDRQLGRLIAKIDIELDDDEARSEA